MRLDHLLSMEKWTDETSCSKFQGQRNYGNFDSLFNFEGPERYGGIAQLGEHLLCKQGVSGSIPLISTKVVASG